jgi:hypothetical protein
MSRDAVRDRTVEQYDYRRTTAITNGVLAPDVRVIGSCQGFNSTGGYFSCGSTGNQLEWRVPMNEDQFSLVATLLLETTGATTAAFSFNSSKGLDFLGLGGSGKKLFYKGGHWGGAHLTSVDTPQPNTWSNTSLFILRTNTQTTW